MLFFIFIFITCLHLTSAFAGTSLDNLDLPKATQLPLFQVQNFDLTRRTHIEEINCENGDVDCKEIFPFRRPQPAPAEKEPVLGMTPAPGLTVKELA